jgi:valyl-tRNA synthetase
MSNNNPKNYGFVVANNEEEARAKIMAKFPELKDKKFTLHQDEDCLDTWFSSWLWPISVFDGINHPDNKDICYYYPTNDLVTGPDIIFFWVARMIMSGYEYRKEECFKNVYFTGIVRDKLGRKMSKQLGNSPDPIELMNKYGADGVRMGMLLSAPAGNDIHFDEALCEQGRNFCNKIWNAFRLVKGWEVKEREESKNDDKEVENDFIFEWFEELIIKTVIETDGLFSKYRLSEALMLIYKLFWDDFCSWYLEAIKPEYGKPVDADTYHCTISFFETLLKLLHPFMPFITEEIWQQISNEKREEVKRHFAGSKEIKLVDTITQSMDFSKPSIMNTDLHEYDDVIEEYDSAEDFVKDSRHLSDFETAKEIITNIRNVRASKNISPKEKLTLQVPGEHNTDYDSIIKKLANVEIQEIAGKIPYRGTGRNDDTQTAVAFIVGTTEYSIPVEINVEEEITKIQSEITYLEGFLKSVNAKLSNEKFVANAKPEIVENERKKQADTEQKILSLRESMDRLKK